MKKDFKLPPNMQIYNFCKNILTYLNKKHVVM